MRILHTDADCLRARAREQSALDVGQGVQNK